MSTPSTGRRYWARQLIDRASTPIPPYGSTEFLMLPNDDPAKVASCVAAAECWAYESEHLEEHLRREITEFARQHKVLDDAAYQAAAAEHRARYKSSRVKPFMERRAAQLASNQARPGDYTGGPVDWDGGEGA